MSGWADEIDMAYQATRDDRKENRMIDSCTAKLEDGYVCGETKDYCERCEDCREMVCETHRIDREDYAGNKYYVCRVCEAEFQRDLALELANINGWRA